MAVALRLRISIVMFFLVNATVWLSQWPSAPPLRIMGPPPGTPTEVRSRTPAAGSSASNKSPEPQPQSPPVIVHGGTPATAHKWE